MTKILVILIIITGMYMFRIIYIEPNLCAYDKNFSNINNNYWNVCVNILA